MSRPQSHQWFAGPALAVTIAISAATSVCLAQERRITVQNLAPFQRKEWITVSIPFAQGAVQGIPELHVDGLPTVWQPFGATWPDGSLRQALCLFHRELGPRSEASLPLLAGTGPGVPEFELTLAQPECTFEVTIDDTTTSAKPRFVELIEDNGARKVVLMRARIGQTGLVAELTLEIYSGQQHAYCGIAVFFSDPATADMDRKLGRVVLRTAGHALYLRHAQRSAVESTVTETGSETILLRDTVLGDGQGIRRAGVLVPPLSGVDRAGDSTLKAATYCRPLGATSWRGTGAYGAFGYVPNPPPWLANSGRLHAAFARRHRDFASTRGVRTDPFQVGAHMSAKVPGQTGDQPDFGVIQLEPVASTGIPSFLFEVEFSILQEACRPVHFFDADTRPIHANEHPQWAVWGGRTHWNPEVSPDRLGKPDEIPRFESHGWQGKIRTHWSANYLCAYYLLTADPQALLEIRNQARLYLAAQTIEPGLATSGPGSSRAVGRCLHTATWLYLCTGDESIRQRMIDRIERIVMPCWQGREAATGKIRPFCVYPPDGRHFGGTAQFWPAWMDSIGVIGAGAVYRVTGNAAAKELADGLALTVLEHGWSPIEHPMPRIVYSMKWTDGRPLDRSRYADQDWIHYSNAISLWGLPALEWARRAATESQQDGLVAKAESLLRRLRAGRSPPPDHWFDRFGQWDAVRLDHDADASHQRESTDNGATQNPRK